MTLSFQPGPRFGLWGSLAPDRPGRGGESARQRPATYSSGTGTDRTAIRFTTHAGRPARRGTYGIPHAGICARGGSSLGYSRIGLGGNRANVSGRGTLGSGHAMAAHAAEPTTSW